MGDDRAAQRSNRPRAERRREEALQEKAELMSTAQPERQLISSGGPWETKVGYSRAVRVGEQVFVSGSTAMRGDGVFVGEGDAYAQTIQTLATIREALEEAGATIEDVVRYRVYVVRHEDWQEVGRALGEVFGHVRPSGTLVGVSWLLQERMLVEIDIDAIIGSGTRG